MCQNAQAEGGTMKNNVGLFLAKRAYLNPRLEAFIDTHSGRRLSFAELDARANRTANFLARELGVRKGDRVGAAADEQPRVHGELLRDRQARRGLRAAQLAAGRRRAAVHPEGHRRDAS